MKANTLSLQTEYQKDAPFYRKRQTCGRRGICFVASLNVPKLTNYVAHIAVRLLAVSTGAAAAAAAAMLRSLP